MNELDFSGKQVLVVGGSSGIGNGIAQAFRAKGARVAVCGTRANPADYFAGEGSDLQGLDYSQLDVSSPQAISQFAPSFDRLDVLVLAQGAVIYRRGEFEMDGFRKVLEVNLMSLMACATKFHAMPVASTTNRVRTRRRSSPSSCNRKPLSPARAQPSIRVPVMRDTPDPVTWRARNASKRRRSRCQPLPRGLNRKSL